MFTNTLFSIPMYMSDSSTSENEDNNSTPMEDNTKTFQKRLLKTFGKVRNQGDYCGGGRLTDVCNPGLMIDGTEEYITFPLLPSQAKLIGEKCSLAPFGRKDETIFDTSIRHTWQLNPSSFRITNSKWNKFTLNNLKPKIVSHLGLDSSWIKNNLIDLQLYKLLLYENGSFFKCHRDSEKVNGMFGTLVIILPSCFNGGEFIIKHNNQEQIFDYSSPKSDHDYHYLVFYADCQHEILPITNGYRLSLVYNVVINKDKIHLCSEIPLPISDEENIQNVCQALINWSEVRNSPLKLVIPLEHKYTEANMSFNLLKNHDRAIASLLKCSIEKLNGDDSHQKYLLYVGLMIHYIERHLDYAEYDDDYRTTSDIQNLLLINETDENYFHQLCQSFCISMKKEISVDKTEFMADEAIWKSLIPYDMKYGDSGNEGTVSEYWYHMGVLLLVPYNRRWHLLNKKCVIKAFPKMCQKAKCDENQIKLKQDCIELINEMLYDNKQQVYYRLFNFNAITSLNSLILLYNSKSDDNQPVLDTIISIITDCLYIREFFSDIDTIYKIGNVIGWNQIGNYIYKAFTSWLKKRNITTVAEFLIAFISNNKTVTIPSHTMINELLAYAFDLKCKNNSLQLIDYCSLLHLLSLYENEYISSLQLISTAIKQTVRNVISEYSYKYVIEICLKPVLIPYLIKIFNNSSPSTSHSKTQLLSPWFVSLYELCLDVLNGKCQQRQAHLHNMIDSCELPLTYKTKRIHNQQTLCVTKTEDTTSQQSQMLQEYLDLKQQLLDMKSSFAQYETTSTRQATATTTSEPSEIPAKRAKKH